jgi:hypothetical protein
MRPSLFTIKNTLALACGSLLTIPSVSAKSYYDDYELYNTPPYSKIIFDGMEGHFPSKQTFPMIKPGQVVAFYATESGEIRTIGCDSFSQDVTMPAGNVVIDKATSISGYTSQQTQGMLQAHETNSNFGSTITQLSLKESSTQKDVSTFNRESTIASANTGNEVNTSRGRSTIAMGDTVNQVTTSHQSSSLDKKTTSSDIESKETATEVSRSTTSSGSETTTGHMDAGEISEGNTKIRTASKTGSVNKASSLGGLSRFIDADFLWALFEEAADLIGFDEESDSLIAELDADEIETLKEANYQWAEILQQNDFSKPLDHYINQLASVRFRDKKKSAEGSYSTQAVCKLSVSKNNSGLHHGHPFAFSFTVKNTGTLPIYDLMILSSPAENTEFLQTQDNTRGYSVNFIEHQKLVLTRLYLPLKPKKSFAAVALEAALPWFIEELTEQR